MHDLFSVHYTELQPKNSTRSPSAINPFTVFNNKHREAIHATTNQHLALSMKRNGTQRRTEVSMQCMHCSMPKGICQAETTSNSEKIQAHNLDHPLLSYTCLKASGR